MAKADPTKVALLARHISNNLSQPAQWRILCRPAAIVAGKTDSGWLAYARLPKDPLRWHLFRQRRWQLKPPFLLARDRHGIDRLVRFRFQKCRWLQGNLDIIPDN